VPCGDVRITRGAVPSACATASNARKSGSGFNTIPGPPPKGTSSTTRWRSVVKSRRSWIFTVKIPRSTARPTTPAASGWSIIAGKIVTISNRILVSRALVQLEQSIRWRDHDALAFRIDDPADFIGQRDEHLAGRTVHDEPACPERSLDGGDDAHMPTCCRLDRASHEVVPVIRAFRQRRQLIRRHSQFGAGKTN